MVLIMSMCIVYGLLTIHIAIWSLRLQYLHVSAGTGKHLINNAELDAAKAFGASLTQMLTLGYDEETTTHLGIRIFKYQTINETPWNVRTPTVAVDSSGSTSGGNYNIRQYVRCNI